METLDLICQFIIPLFGVTASFLVGSISARTRMYAGALGLAAEPAWIVTSYINQQWGIIVLAVFYAYTWWRVFNNNRMLLK